MYVAIGITSAGMQEVLGLWTLANEGAKFWLSVLTELQNHGLKDIFIACVDGLKSFPQTIETIYPKTTVQLRMVHRVRASLNYVNWKERKNRSGPEGRLPCGYGARGRAAIGSLRRVLGSTPCGGGSGRE